MKQILIIFGLGLLVGISGVAIYHELHSIPVIDTDNYATITDDLVTKIAATHCPKSTVTECLAEFPEKLMMSKFCYSEPCPAVEHSLIACPVCPECEGPDEEDYRMIQSDLNLCKSRLNNFLY